MTDALLLKNRLIKNKKPPNFFSGFFVFWVVRRAMLRLNFFDRLKHFKN
jgi:hypothetical protein